MVTEISLGESAIACSPVCGEIMNTTKPPDPLTQDDCIAVFGQT
jgi:hypothetical protein